MRLSDRETLRGDNALSMSNTLIMVYCNIIKLGAPNFADFEVAADEIAARNWPPCKRPTI